MTGVRGMTSDGRPAWLLSLPRREWVVVSEETEATLARERHRFWQKGLYLLLILLILNPLLDYLLDVRTSPWVALLLAQLHLMQENWSWKRRLRQSGELVRGGVKPVDLPRPGFWQALAYVPLLLALPVVYLDWRPGGMGPRAFLVLMLLFWALIAVEIQQLRRIRALAEDSGEADGATPLS